jgi:hypothetical protein
MVSDKDIIFKGNDGGSTIEAMRIDMSAGGDVVIGATSAGNYKFAVSGTQFNIANFVRTNNYGAIINVTNGTGTNMSMGMDDDEVRYLGSSTTKYLDFGASGNTAKFHGKLGVGVGPTDAMLHTHSGNSASIVRLATGSNSSASSLRIQGGNASESNIWMGDEDDADIGKIVYGHSGNYMAFTANAAERMRINSSGRVGIGTASPYSAANTHELTIFNSSTAWNQRAGIFLATENQGTYNSEIYYHRGTSNDDDRGLKFRVHDTEVMTLQSSGKVGIGTTSPGDYYASADNLVVKDSGSAGISIISGSSSEGVLAFGDGTGGSDEATGGVVYIHSSNTMRFNCANDYPLYLGSKKIVGRTVMNLSSGSNRWDNSGVWGNLGGSLASTANSLQNQASGCMYLCEAAIQHLQGYTASMLVYKTSSGAYQVIKITNTSGEMRMNGHYVQYRQQSGADQTGTSGFQRISAVMGTGTAS